jgi:hypothetical protein
MARKEKLSVWKSQKSGLSIALSAVENSKKSRWGLYFSFVFEMKIR